MRIAELDTDPHWDVDPDPRLEKILAQPWEIQNKSRHLF